MLPWCPDCPISKIRKEGKRNSRVEGRCKRANDASEPFSVVHEQASYVPRAIALSNQSSKLDKSWHATKRQEENYRAHSTYRRTAKDR